MSTQSYRHGRRTRAGRQSLYWRFPVLLVVPHRGGPPIFLPAFINSGSKWRTLRTSWKPRSALALPPAPAISTRAFVLTRTGAHSGGQHSHAPCLWPSRQAWAHLRRVALGFSQGLVLLTLPECYSTACSPIQREGGGWRGPGGAPVPPPTYSTEGNFSRVQGGLPRALLDAGTYLSRGTGIWECLG